MGTVYEKTGFMERVIRLSCSNRITVTVTKDIIKEYISYSKESLLNGNTIEIYGICYIEPDLIQQGYKKTLAYDCKVISERLKIPYQTVYFVLKAYFEALKQDIFNGKNVEVRGIVDISTLVDSDSSLFLNCHISTALKSLIQNSDCVISSARVHTNRIFKDTLKQTYLKVG